eukprot:gnl/MRDRNA2_/MRDRNA2_104703_c0_seq1.p1 gnl/MRDRNA2_/MRDRNA2_104703_c0~~gnl/MRDRNA2_/MRDRNA2_104703_c0_seq1.p1  ORF type:complete len:695 (+),score=195.92 gnl/MRDRNA2_/MRDRNA2_104703_c0_seq1:78-2162(+)
MNMWNVADVKKRLNNAAEKAKEAAEQAKVAASEWKEQTSKDFKAYSAQAKSDFQASAAQAKLAAMEAAAKTKEKARSAKEEFMAKHSGGSKYVNFEKGEGSSSSSMLARSSLLGDLFPITRKASGETQTASSDSEAKRASDALDFLEQLQTALADLQSEASRKGENDLDALCACLQGLEGALQNAGQASVLSLDDYPALVSSPTAHVLLALCGFCEVKKDANGKQLFVLSDQGARLSDQTLSIVKDAKAAIKIEPGLPLTLEMMVDLGVDCDWQDYGTSTCAIHSLNNITQAPQGVVERAAAMKARAEAEALAKESGEAVLIETGLFSLKDLQEADGFLGESLQDQNQDGSQKRKGSFQSERIGMFDVEAIKLSASRKGFEVIDIEPTPQWSTSAAAGYVDAAHMVDFSGVRERWFFGFLVYEQIPNRSPHYYVIVLWPAGGGGEEQHWMKLDSLDSHSDARNRIMCFDDVINCYNRHSNWLRSWLVRWYPVINKRGAVTALQAFMDNQQQVQKESSRDAIATSSSSSSPPLVSAEQAEALLASESVRWNVTYAANNIVETQQSASGTSVSAKSVDAAVAQTAVDQDTATAQAKAEATTQGEAEAKAKEEAEAKAKAEAEAQAKAEADAKAEEEKGIVEAEAKASAGAEADTGSEVKATEETADKAKAASALRSLIAPPSPKAEVAQEPADLLS